ncbi:hypothetical protein L0F51_03925 [Afifella sp. H1R]|uniref:hypothetical protein n=1 Tax=Afifella sp. H1R TaxID=2908841 RepID=UPI001F31AB4A|nr:hypothetical protein [Afifella sp. H1R]MCF1502914.1 hypothetical protein [Afifella sp. H1R]
MLMRNKDGGTEGMRYGPAMAAVAAGTHEVVNVDVPAAGSVASEASADLDDMTKAELIAEAKRRGVELDDDMLKADILARLKKA